MLVPVGTVVEDQDHNLFLAVGDCACLLFWPLANEGTVWVPTSRAGELLPPGKFIMERDLRLSWSREGAQVVTRDGASH